MGIDSENVKLEAIKRTINRYPHISKLLYADFHARMNAQPVIDGLQELIDSKVPDAKDRQLLNTFKIFNNSLLKTNFYKEDIGSIGYRLDPKIFLTK